MGKKDQLNARQERFSLEYLVDLNAKQASIRAGYSPRTAEHTGSVLLKHPKVASRIDALKAERAEATKFTSKVVLEQLANLSLTTIEALIGPDGYLVGNLANLPSSVLACIAELTQDTLPDGTKRIKVKLHNRLRALELAGRHVEVGAYRDTVEVTHSLVDVVDELKKRRERQDQEHKRIQ